MESDAALLMDDVEVTILDLNDYEMPLYGIDLENEEGIPDLAIRFKQVLSTADGLIISFAEHNGAYTAAFKNIMDWISRVEKDVWNNLPMLLMATSPGGRGGQTVLDIAVSKFKFMTTGQIEHFSLPFFEKNFSDEDGVLDEDLKRQWLKVLDAFSKAVKG